MHLFGIHTRETAERVVDAFRHPDQLPKALAPLFIRRKDDVPCRKWSWSNQLVVALSGTADARGIRQWNAWGRRLKKGSRAIWILAPCVKSLETRNENGDTENRSVVYGFRSVPVFALEDTEGDPLPEADDRYASWLQELPLAAVARAWNIDVNTYNGESRAALGFYRYGAAGQSIQLGTENLATWAHELVHAADHRLTELQGAAWHKEVVAELGSAVLLECLGLHRDADLGGAYRYIEHHARQVDKSLVKACLEALDRVCNCVALILDTAEQLHPSVDNTPSLTAK